MAVREEVDQGGEAALAALLGGRATSFLRAVLDASPDCIKVVELDGSLSYLNENGRRAMEIDDFGVIGGTDWASLWPAEQRGEVLCAIAKAARGENHRFEAFCPTAKGTPRWWDVSVAPVPGPGGKPERLVSISRDVTDRVEEERAVQRHQAELERLALAQAETLQDKERLLREKDLLMKEADHRVKNSLALVRSLLNVQGRNTPDDSVRHALGQAAQRIGTVASIHERLYQGGPAGQIEFCSYLQGLCKDLERSLGEGFGIQIIANCEEISLPAERATVLGLVVAEFVTNAVRHAFDEGSGTVRVDMNRTAENTICLTVKDDGKGLPVGFDPEKSPGLGMRVVYSYAYRYGWQVEAKNDGGAKFCVTID